MIYSSQRAQAIQKKDIAYLAAGIHDNVVLESIRVDKSLNGIILLSLNSLQKMVNL